MRHDGKTKKNQTPLLIGLDWGSTSLRAYLIAESGEVLASQTRAQGVLQIPDKNFEDIFWNVVSPWHEQWPMLPILASGMIGSTVGWQEIPYINCPVGSKELAKHLAPIHARDGKTLFVVPGVIHDDTSPNVIRGEETQLIGALHLAPQLAAHAHFVMPGTHSKWVTIQDEKIRHFSTYITGELFSVLRDHSILGQPSRNIETTLDWGAFTTGLAVARHSGPAGIFAQLFSTRSLVLTKKISASVCLDYLSGLLIGEELRSGLHLLADTKHPIVLLGDNVLCDRYHRAFHYFGKHDVLIIENSASHGLWHIFCGASL